MARSRNIKPSFFTNEQVSDNCPLGRLLFIGLWTMADYKGDLEWKEKTLKIQILPWDDCSVKELAINLDKSGLVRFYSDGNKIYLNIPNFEKHQNPHKNERDKGSDIPHYSDDMRQAVDFKQLTINRDLSGFERNNSHSDRADSLLRNPDSLKLNPDNPKSAQAPIDALENPDPVEPVKPAKAKQDYPEWFEEIWKHYPTRAGGDNKRMAFQKAGARVKEGKSHQDLFDAVDRYKYYVVCTGSISTQYVKQAAVFFGSIDNINNPWTPPALGASNGANNKPYSNSSSASNRPFADTVRDQARTVIERLSGDAVHGGPGSGTLFEDGRVVSQQGQIGRTDDVR